MGQADIELQSLPANSWVFDMHGTALPQVQQTSVLLSLL